MSRVYCAMFTGQGGWLFSQGVYHLAKLARRLGAHADVYRYVDSAKAQQEIESRREHGYEIAGVGYSLGVSAVTELQRRCDFELVFCIAGSTLAINYPINKENTERSVLWKGPGVLSSADNLNFDKVYITTYKHLFVTFDPKLVASFTREINALISGKPVVA